MFFPAETLFIFIGANTLRQLEMNTQADPPFSFRTHNSVIFTISHKNRLRSTRIIRNKLENRTRIDQQIACCSQSGFLADSPPKYLCATRQQATQKPKTASKIELRTNEDMRIFYLLLTIAQKFFPFCDRFFMVIKIGTKIF